MAKRPPEKLAAALKANLKRRKSPKGLDAPKDAAPQTPAKDPPKTVEKPANPPSRPAKS